MTSTITSKDRKLWRRNPARCWGWCRKPITIERYRVSMFCSDKCEQEYTRWLHSLDTQALSASELSAT